MELERREGKLNSILGVWCFFTRESREKEGKRLITFSIYWYLTNFLIIYVLYLIPAISCPFLRLSLNLSLILSSGLITM
jgi:hypothetical protein